jgi:predicted esterase/Ca2+-binding EF-hand superfamily protein
MGSRPGAVLDSAPLSRELWPAHAVGALRVLYRSVGYDGAGRDVSGSVFLPAGEPPAGGWPVVSYAHGTSGLSDRCAPSRVGLSRLERDHVARWLAAGHVVAATDYEGLATSGPHPYFNGVAVADDVIDIVRATRRLDDRVGRSWLVAGFSQGGHAALFVGLVASRYAPELNFRGTVAMAPPVHLPMLVGIVAADRHRPVSIFLPYLLAGVRTSHPDFDARVFLTELGGRVVDAATTAPLGDMFRAVKGLTNEDMGTTDIHYRPDVTRILAACRVPVTRMDRPVYVTAGTADEVVPVAVVERFVADLRQAATDVRFDRYDGAMHADLLGAGHDRLIAWTREAMIPTTPTTPATPPTRFTLLDANGDGYLTRDDYDVFALRLAQAFGEPPGSRRALAVRQGYRALWQAVAARADRDADGRVSQEEFLAWLVEADAFDREVGPLAEAVLALADADHDGRLDMSELESLLRACDLPADQVTAVFDVLDCDHDSSVSAYEIAATVRDFCRYPEEGGPGHWLFGRF